MLDDRQRFKLGFITRCIEEGMTAPDEICAFAKQAADHLDTLVAQPEKQAGRIMDVIGKALTLSGATMAVAPPLLGATAGYGLARATDIDEDDVEEAKQQELIQEYRRHTNKLRRMRGL